MRMHVIGACELHGISKKTGKQYDLTIVTATHRNLTAGAKGLKAEEVTLDAAQVPADSVEIDKDYMIDYDSHGHCIGFEIAD